MRLFDLFTPQGIVVYIMGIVTGVFLACIGAAIAIHCIMLRGLA